MYLYIFVNLTQCETNVNSWYEVCITYLCAKKMRKMRFNPKVSKIPTEESYVNAINKEQ